MAESGREHRCLAAAVGLTLTLAISTLAEARSPRVEYLLNCGGCHRADGAGTPGKVPALKGQMGSFLRVPGGRNYLVQVPGTAQSSLDDDGVAAVLNWMLKEFSAKELPADFTPYTGMEISRIRRPLINAGEVRRRLVSMFEN